MPPSSRTIGESRLEAIDPNLRDSVNSSELNWIDGFDARLAIRGLAFPKEAVITGRFHRLPDAAAASVSDAVRSLSRAPASVFISFFTDSPDLSVRLVNEDCEFMRPMTLAGSAGAELYLREGAQWLPVAVAIPSPQNRQKPVALCNFQYPFFRPCVMLNP